MTDEPIEAWVVDETSKGALEQGLKLVEVDPASVRAGLDHLRSLLPDDHEPEDGSLRRWRMEEVKLSVELSGSAGIRLVGTTTIGAKSAIEVKFVRKAD